MDSKVVNKLIRSEVWPVLRRQGFSKFDGRNAWRYRGPLVDVVNFQSFNSHLADGVGCTTFSFALNLGVFLRGSTFGRRVKRDSIGLARPQEYECSFRVNLKKRTPVDGFERADIFYVAPDGSTTAVVLKEAIYLLEEHAPPWFTAFEDLGSVVLAMSENGTQVRGTETLGLGASGAPGSYYACDLLASLKLELHSQSPDSISASACLAAINASAQAKLDIFSPAFTTAIEVEIESYRLRDLLMGILGSISIPQDEFAILPPESQLFGANWSTGPNTLPSIPIEGTGRAVLSARECLWPQLRANGFVEFSDRLAHRPTGNSVEVVSFIPMDPVEKRANGYPSGLFRIGLGIFWPEIAEHEGGRRNRRGEFRPKYGECQLQMWLMPAMRAAVAGPTCFDSAELALKALREDAERWFSLCRSGEMFSRLLEQPEWQILVRYPTMRGHGSYRSVFRAILQFALSGQSPEARAAHLKAAHEAVNHQSEHLQPRFRSWVEKIELRCNAT
jgi:hypothetical protein